MRISDWSSDVCSSDLQDGRAEEAVGIPPVAGAGGRAAGAEDALIEAVELLALFRRLLALARRGGTLGLHPRLDRGVLRVEVGKVRHQVLHHRHMRQRIDRSEEHTSELQSLMRISYAVLCLKKNKSITPTDNTKQIRKSH